MPTTDTKIKSPIVNVLTKAQYDSISSPSSEEFYLITDDTNIVAGDGIEVITSSNGQSLINNTCKPLCIGFTPADSTQTEWQTGRNMISLDTTLSIEELFYKLEQGEDISFVDRLLTSASGTGSLGKFFVSEWYSDDIETRIRALSLTTFFRSEDQAICYIWLLHNPNNSSDDYQLWITPIQSSGSDPIS